MSRGRPSGALTRCGGRWTEAKFRSFVKGNLRSATRKWAPINDCKKKAHARRGFYICACCKEESPATILVDRKRVKNIYVDHIDPIVDPSKGFEGWDKMVDRMFCEEDNLQVLCKKCHDLKTQEEKEIAKIRRQKEKDQDDE